MVFKLKSKHTSTPTALPSFKPFASLKTSPVSTAPAAANEQSPEEFEKTWFGAPVFDISFWHDKGGMDKVREKREELVDGIEVLVLTYSTASNTDWDWHSLALGWPNVHTIDIECDVCNVETDQHTTRWLRIIQDQTLFPCAHTYRLTARWAGFSEVFEHPIGGRQMGSERQARLALVRHLPPHITHHESELLFLKYRLLFLAAVSFDMGEIEKTPQGSRCMYTYLNILLKTDVLGPKTLKLNSAKAQGIRTLLETINRNEQRLNYPLLRSVTDSTALQFSLRQLTLDMRKLTDGKTGIQFCAAHFPKLESLIIRHSPDLTGSQDQYMELGVLFSLPWKSLVELQLPFMTDSLSRRLRDKCPALQFLVVRPEPRYERWPEYSKLFTPTGLRQLARQWLGLKQLIVNYAFRNYAVDTNTDTSLAVRRGTISKGRTNGTFSRASLSAATGTRSIVSAASELASLANSMIPGPASAESFTVQHASNNIRVLSLPYLQLTFATAFKLLEDLPHLRIFEFMSMSEKSESPPASISAGTFRRLTSLQDAMTPKKLFDVDALTKNRIKTRKPPLENLILHDACNEDYLHRGWIDLLNLLAQLTTVTFVTINSDDIGIANRITQNCRRYDANFVAECEDRTQSYRTCEAFAKSWSKVGGMYWGGS